MKELLNHAYLVCLVGETRWIRHDPWQDGTLLAFQSVLESAKFLQHQGDILIRDVHRDQHLGSGLVDGIQILRLR